MTESSKIARKIIQFSFIFWSIIFVVFNVEYIISTIYITITFLYLSIPKENTITKQYVLFPSTKKILLLLVGLIAIINIPELISRNVFINAGRVGDEISIAENQISTGRSLGSLIYSSFQLLPIVILDMYKKKWSISFLVLLFLFLMSGSSRGYITIVLLSIIISKLIDNKAKFNFKTLRKFGVYGSLIIFFFTILSQLRDGSTLNVLSITPLFLGFFYPGFNSNLLMEIGVERDFLLLYKDLLLKFIPSAIYPGKEIFSFNIEMTYLIYDFMKVSGLDAISVFTYIPEFLIYKPTVLAVLFPALMLLFFYKIIFKICSRYNLNTTIIYISLYTFIVLKSRVLDLISFLVFTLISLLIITLVNRIKKA